MIAELSSADISVAELSCFMNKGVHAISSESAFILGVLENRGNTLATCSWNCLFTATERGEHNSPTLQVPHVGSTEMAQCNI